MDEAALVLSLMAAPEVLLAWFGGLLQREGRRGDYAAASLDVADHIARAGVDRGAHLGGEGSVDHLLCRVPCALPCNGGGEGRRGDISPSPPP